MTDFAALLDAVVRRKLRRQLMDHVASYRHTEFGHARPLDAEERALILNVVDNFLVGRSLTILRLPQLDDLYRRLNECASEERIPSADQYLRYRNACFDAMACIKEMEGRLRAGLDRYAFNSRQPNGCPVPSNDF